LQNTIVIKRYYQRICKVIAVVIFFLTFSIENHVIAQCDPLIKDLCEIGNNSVIQACYHAQIAKTSNGYSITGEDFAPNGIAYQTVLTNIPSSSYSMPQDVVPIWGAIGGRTQAVFLGSDGKIYAIGEEDLLIDESNTNNPAWGVTRLKLPTGLTVCDVNKWQGTAGSGSDNNNSNSNNAVVTGDTDGFLVFSTESGKAYITGDGASAIQSQASNTEWTQIQLPSGISVVNFAVGYRTLLVQGSDGNLYASGPDTYLGDGTRVDLDILTILPIQPEISLFGISQIEAGFNSFMVLDGDGTIHVLGENSEGGLGVGNTINVTEWSKVGAECDSGVLTNVAYISTLSTHDYRINSSAILVNGTVRSWGSNTRQAITTGDDMLIPCPILPTGNNRNAVAISNGGHISPYVNTSVQICNIGHNRQGAFGDGNDEEGDYGEYNCRTIPGQPEICGTKEADLGLEKTVNNINPSTGEDIVFSITVTNYGPEPSTGSFVRDQLSAGFYYLNDDSQGAYNRITGLWTVGPLEVGASTTLNITVKAIEAGSQINYTQILVDNEVDVNSTPGDNSTDQNDDDIVVMTVIFCPIDSSHILLCPEDSIAIGGQWIYESGTYVETVPLSTNCDSLHIFRVAYLEVPREPEIQPNCESLEYIVSVEPSSIWSTLWDNGDTNNQTIYDGSDLEAILTLESASNCVLEQVVDLPPFPKLEDIPILTDTTIFRNTPLEIETGLDPAMWRIRWSPEGIVQCRDCTSTSIVPSENTIVTLLLEHISGCTFESSFLLSVKKEPEHIIAPNIFTPTSGSLNNTWKVSTSSNITITKCNIFDRWGKLIFQTKDGSTNWDGKFQYKDCAQGVYIYVVKYLDSDNTPQIKYGDVTLIR